MSESVVDTTRALADSLVPVDHVDGVELIKGVVFSQNGRNPNVNLAGSTTAVPVHCAGSWTVPSNGTTCWVLRSGPVLLMLAQ